MLSIKLVEERPDFIRQKMALRGIEADLDEFLSLSQDRKAMLRRIEDLRYELNKTSKQIGQMKKTGEDATDIIVAMKKISDEIKSMDDEYKNIEVKLQNLLLNIPNIPHESVPEGLSPDNNVEVRAFGEKPTFSFPVKPHWELGKDLGILDFERASKLVGSRFAIYLGAGALLERALINFMLDIHTREKGYTEVIPPFIANAESLTGTGNLPKFEEDLFKIRGQEWYLIPTAEVPLTNMYREEILDSSSLPQRFVAYTPCFRSEAGSYGKDIRGLIRQHQFNKVELASFALPEKSYEELEKITADAEEILKRLGLCYRVVVLCTGDMGFAGAKTYDLELWMPHRKKFLEISSCTNCEDFQARRANIRFRRQPKSKPEFVHTLNGSGVALGRTVSALLESYQQEDGSVLIPEILRSYMDGLDRITPA
ncbi:MAG TPA: serine--tRNA ligase [Candidatus Heimdallarchaeota archaeon]|nr:serine--tRNA ligase [Candidatus Heimdallarchaeota archaeon]